MLFDDYLKMKKGDYVLTPEGELGVLEWKPTSYRFTASVGVWYKNSIVTQFIDTDDLRAVPKDVNGWLRRTHRKGPYKLYRTHINDDNTRSYTVIFKDRGKVRIGVISDGQYARYGISTFGALSFPEVTGLWQSGTGAVSEDQLDLMIQFWNNESELPDWSVIQLKGIKW